MNDQREANTMLDTKPPAECSGHRACLRPTLVLVLLAALSACGGSAEGPARSSAGSPAQTDTDVEPDADGGAALDEVHLGESQASALGIRVEALPEGRASSILSRPATLMLDLDRKAVIGPRIEAKVVRVVKDLGEEVQEGDTLAILGSVELGRAKSAFLTARARLRTREATFHRETELFQKSISSEAELMEAEAGYQEAQAERDAAREALRLYGLTTDEIDKIQPGGERPLSHFPLRSTVSGRIQQRDLVPGQTVGPDETPIHVAGVERLWVMIEAFERDVPLLETGQAVRLSVRSLPERTFDGELDWISYQLDPDTRTVRARAVVDNPDGTLRGGMFGTARIRTSRDGGFALVPADAVQSLDGNDIVFVPGDEPGAFRPVQVRLGDESEDGLVEIVSGIGPGERAVVAGAFDLKSAATAASRSADHGH